MREPLGTATRHPAGCAITGVTLLWLALAGPLLAAGPEPRLRVVYHPPTLSVEAREVSLAQVLEAIGASVGFTVVDSGGARPGLTLSLTDLPLDEVLQRLLRGENHVLIYGHEGGAAAGVAVHTLALKGPASPAALASGEPRRLQGRPEETIPLPGTLTPASGSKPARHPATWAAEGPRGDGRVAGDGAGWQVEDILRSHALSGPGPLTGGIPSATVSPTVDQPGQSLAHALEPDSTGGPSSGPVPPDLEEALAITTRLAQEQLSALVAGLATATQSLGLSLAAGGR